MRAPAPKRSWLPYLESAREALRPLDGAPGTAALAALTQYLGDQIARLGAA